jgi:16S rRNA (adenine1518-N6/adenine1519-N6)-dimethyltransferase
LTRYLANNCNNVLAVESDPRLVEILREQLMDLPNVTVIAGNVLKVRVPSFSKAVSIPPYQVSSRLLLWLFNRGFDCAVLIFQKEFANRLVASIGSEDYGWLTVLAYYYAEVELLDNIPKIMFYPQPKVDSIIVCLKSRKSLLFKVKDEVMFAKMVQSLFAKRNRKVRNAVLPFMEGVRIIPKEKAAELVEVLPFRDRRVRELAPEDFGALADALCG